MNSDKRIDSIKAKKIDTWKVSKDKTYKTALIMISSFILIFIIGMILFLFIRGIQGFIDFDSLRIGDFLFGGYYNPTGDAFAVGFMVINTIYLSTLALLIAVPISVLTALFVTKIVPKKVKPLFYISITILSAIPTVIYGAFGLFILDSIVTFLFDVGPGTSLSVVLTLAFMIVPTITILTITSIETVNQKVQDSALALGATKTQTSFKITLRGAQKGILVAILLGLGRAIGEATAVSMVASQSSYGPTFGLLDYTTLITATMLLGFSEAASGSIEEASFFAMASLLMITIIILFISMKILESKFDVERRSKKASSFVERKKRIYKKVDANEINELNFNDLKLYTKDLQSQKVRENEEENISVSRSIADVYTHNSYSENRYLKSTVYKKRQTRFLNTLTWIFSMFGVVLLLSIILFLFIDGVNVLNWDFLTTRGVYMVDAATNQNIYGLAIPLFGTMFIVIVSISISLTIGLLIAILTSVYLKQNSKLSNTLDFFVRLLTGIPSLIYGIIGSIIFVPLFSNDIIQFNSLSAALTISFFVLPTILKTTQDGFAQINPSQKTGSLSLGSTNSITTRKVLLKQALPSIISGAIIATGMVIADSAIFITIYGTISQSSADNWLQSGGTTLSTEIYKLTKQDEILWEYVKGIGLVIILLILIISTLSSKVKNSRYYDAGIILFSLLVLLISIFYALFIFFVIGLIILTIGIIIIPTFEKINKRYRMTSKIKQKYYERTLDV